MRAWNLETTVRSFGRHARPGAIFAGSTLSQLEKHAEFAGRRHPLNGNATPRAEALEMMIRELSYEYLNLPIGCDISESKQARFLAPQSAPESEHRERLCYEPALTESTTWPAQFNLAHDFGKLRKCDQIDICAIDRLNRGEEAGAFQFRLAMAVAQISVKLPER